MEKPIFDYEKILYDALLNNDNSNICIIVSNTNIFG
jgi:hypothetical protein